MMKLWLVEKRPVGTPYNMFCAVRQGDKALPMA